jgi:hypothetical protein
MYANVKLHTLSFFRWKSTLETHVWAAADVEKLQVTIFSSNRVENWKTCDAFLWRDSKQLHLLYSCSLSSIWGSMLCMNSCYWYFGSLLGDFYTEKQTLGVFSWAWIAVHIWFKIVHFLVFINHNIDPTLQWRPGIVAIASPSRPEDRGFESRRGIRFSWIYTLQCCWS